MATKDAFSVCHMMRPIEAGTNLNTGRIVITCAKAEPLDLSDVSPSCSISLEVAETLGKIVFGYSLPAITTFGSSVSVMYDILPSAAASE